jgi:hypothetical protein
MADARNLRSERRRLRQVLPRRWRLFLPKCPSCTSSSTQGVTVALFPVPAKRSAGRYSFAALRTRTELRSLRGEVPQSRQELTYRSRGKVEVRSEADSTLPAVVPENLLSLRRIQLGRCGLRPDLLLSAQPVIAGLSVGAPFFLVEMICEGGYLGFLVNVRLFCGTRGLFFGHRGLVKATAILAPGQGTS